MKSGLEVKLTALLLGVLISGGIAGAELARSFANITVVIIITAAGVWPTIWCAGKALRPMRRLLRAMTGIVASYREGDFSQSLVIRGHDEFARLSELHNELGAALRERHSELVQRERLLETVMRQSPVAIVLVDGHQRVVYGNLAAARLLNEGRGLPGQDFTVLMHRAPASMRHAVESHGDSIFTAEIAGSEETFHLSERSFRLQGRTHRLYLLKSLTREFSRREAAIWKNLFRILSHELNNSLAPITSLANSGAKLNKQGNTTELATVFETIRERAAHLHLFISRYAAFAKLPPPNSACVDWQALIHSLAQQHTFRLCSTLPTSPGWFDRAQIEQALINLLKNAHETNGPAEDIELYVGLHGNEHRIEVRDRGPGMSKIVLAQALLPFYSTKRNGTGIGLALAREISEAHGGRIQLENRVGGGLSVALLLPLRSPGVDAQRPSTDSVITGH